VTSYAEYGELSKRDPEELLAGARVDVAAYKENPGDFVLWKPSSEDQPGWDSPWGRGRPGWHIECTAMAAKHLGDTIDIHGGGNDLVFPHHENERAQSTCSHGAKFVNYWLHNGLINMNQEKMSKSLGNVLLLKDLAKDIPGEVIRYILLSAHYRAPLDWSDDAVQQAKSSLDRLYGALRKMTHIDLPSNLGVQIPPAFDVAMSDDLNTPRALAELFALSKQANTANSDEQRAICKAALLQSGEWLGLLQQDPEEWFAAGSDDLQAAEIEQLINDRALAKAEKDWGRADEIRNLLSDMNVVLEDSADGTTWRIEN
jgi:cysteinyl-tRNA synthetase